MSRYIPPFIRQAVKDRFGGHCGYCGEKPKKLQVDHIEAHARGGSNDIDNLMPACHSCNNYKHGFSLEEFRGEISMQPYRLSKTCGYRLAKRFKLVQQTGEPVIFYFERTTVHQTVEQETE